ncbi:secretion activator protein [Hoeflea sp. WL0058]|uniref:Secretion activator protein n=1 Tax=Flavimaribacter sediminis TaxID=2865987 RepID=A0AAE2ZTN8_9HYPH|nr:glycosyl hydrolase 108 family protein [Flavimaribacter sediminis]MBW8640375.1 secretion activator protein [Flavimaribacter sediminis]
MSISKSERFNICHTITAKWEGGWSNHAADPGGKTMYGVTEATYQAWLKKRRLAAKPVRQISYSEALRLYRDEYWHPTAVKYNLVPGVDLAVYDAAVNSGVSRGLKWLKASVGSSDHTVTARAICRKRLSFMQSLKIWKTFGKGWSNRVADIEVKAVAMAAEAMTKGVGEKAKQRTAQKLEEIARREVVDGKDETAFKQKVSAASGAGGSLTGGGVAVDPADFDMLTSWVVGGVAAAAVLVAIVLIVQSRAASARVEAYREVLA